MSFPGAPGDVPGGQWAFEIGGFLGSDSGNWTLRSCWRVPFLFPLFFSSPHPPPLTYNFSLNLDRWMHLEPQLKSTSVL